MPGAEVRIALHPGGFPHDHALETALSDFPVGFPLPLVETIYDVMQARFCPLRSTRFGTADRGRRTAQEHADGV